MSRIHRENPDATPEEIEVLQLAQLMKVRPSCTSHEVHWPNCPDCREVRLCRDCGQDFQAPQKVSHKTKWGSLCATCLRWEL